MSTTKDGRLELFGEVRDMFRTDELETMEDLARLGWTIRVFHGVEFGGQGRPVLKVYMGYGHHRLTGLPSYTWQDIRRTVARMSVIDGRVRSEGRGFEVYPLPSGMGEGDPLPFPNWWGATPR